MCLASSVEGGRRGRKRNVEDGSEERKWGIQRGMVFLVSRKWLPNKKSGRRSVLRGNSFGDLLKVRFENISTQSDCVSNFLQPFSECVLKLWKVDVPGGRRSKLRAKPHDWWGIFGGGCYGPGDCPSFLRIGHRPAPPRTAPSAAPLRERSRGISLAGATRKIANCVSLLLRRPHRVQLTGVTCLVLT